MDRCPAPWSETPPPPLPTPPQQQSSVQNQTAEDQQAVSHHCDAAADGSPTTHRGSRSPSSPSGPAPPDALQFAYSTTVEQPVENMTVIRGHRSLSPEHSPAGEPLVYQTLGDSPGFLNQYGISYTNFSPTPTSSAQVGTSSAYNYVKGYQGDIIQMVPGYDNDSPRAMSPSGSVLYTLQYPTQDVTHTNAHPMWGAAVTNNNGSGYPFSSGLGSPSLETNDVGSNGRNSYSAFTGNPAYMLTSGNEAAGWATLPSITSSYLSDSRRSQYTEPPPEYSRIPEPPQHQCAVCGGTDSSPWRRDSTGQFICNSCAIYKNGVTARSNAMRPARRLTTSRRAGMTCSNCSTTDTTLWRRNTQGEPVCNACGLYYKLHQVNRPITMRKDSIQTRKRKPKSTASATKGKAHSTNSNTNGSSSKSPSATSTSVSSAASYLPQGGMDGDLSDAQHHRLVQSPLLPSSTALSQQLPHFPPLDPPHGSEIILENGIVLEHPSVISVAPNKQL